MSDFAHGSPAPAPSSGAARRARERKQRGTARHMASLVATFQTSQAHHTSHAVSQNPRTCAGCIGLEQRLEILESQVLEVGAEQGGMECGPASVKKERMQDDDAQEHKGQFEEPKQEVGISGTPVAEPPPVEPRPVPWARQTAPPTIPCEVVEQPMQQQNPEPAIGDEGKVTAMNLDEDINATGTLHQACMAKDSTLTAQIRNYAEKHTLQEIRMQIDTVFEEDVPTRRQQEKMSFLLHVEDHLKAEGFI